jgi:hypothetical protein
MKYLQVWKSLVVMMVAAILTACGGGGGSAGTSASGTGTAAPAPTLTVLLYNSSNAVVNTVTASGGNYFKAVFKDASGLPIPNKVVNFTAPAFVTLAATTALTDASGTAQVGVVPTAGTGAAAGTLSVSAIEGTTTATGKLDFAVAASGQSATPVMTIQIFNSANVAVSNVKFGDGNYVKATFKGGDGTPIVNRLVNFTVSSALATLATPTALTNAQGEAQVSIAPASVSTVGAATVTASALDSGNTFSASADFAVAAANISLSAITLGSKSLSQGGSTSVVVTATSNGAPASGVNVSFSVDCGTVTNLITTDGNGVANATYSAVKVGGGSCSGTVTLSASAVGTPIQKASLTVAAPVATSISFVSATPGQIFVKGSGALDNSQVLFKVTDSTGAAMPNVGVTASLSINPGGVGLGSSGSTTPVTGTTDVNGAFTVNVFSGTIPGPVEVRAALTDNPIVFTTSKNLTVASGPPSQNYFSLSVLVSNIEGNTIDGSSTTLTVRAADRQGNPVPDGTVINFTAEGGQVAPSCATARVGGIAQCSVPLVSQNPRSNNGRVTVLAYAEGLKQFTDVNGNNAYDPGTDTLFDQGDAYRDDNENGSYDVGEFVIPKGGTQACAGSGGTVPSRANTCTGVNSLATTVRQEAVILFAASNALIDPTGTTSGTLVVKVNSADPGLTLLPMPSGTTVTALPQASGCSIVTTINGVVGNVVPHVGSPNEDLGTTTKFGISGCSGTPITVQVKSPGGTSTYKDVNIP